MDVRGNARPVGRKTYWLLAALVTVSAALGAGCVFTDLVAYMLVPFVDDKVPPKCKEITSCDKEVTVVVATSFDHLEQRPDYQWADRELSERLVATLKGRFDTNHNKVKLVPAAKVHSYLSQSARGLDMHALGKHFHADFVIALEIHRMEFFEVRSRDLFRGTASMTVTALDVRKPRGEATILEEEYRSEYPKDNPIPAEGRGPGQFRTLFINQLAVDLSRWFAATPAEETRFGFGEQTPNWQ